MMRTFVATSAVLLTALALNGGVAADDTRGLPDFCAADPARVVSLALADPALSLALVTVEESPAADRGATLLVEEVLDGGFASNTIVTDIPPAGGCDDAYVPGGKAFASILYTKDDLTGDEALTTIQSWPLLAGDGTALPDGPLSPATDISQLVTVLPGGTTLTIEELMEAGRNYVEPTPTPLPPGVPTPDPNLAPPDTSAPTVTGVMAPNTGTGNGRGRVPGVALLALIVAAAAAGVGALAVARRA